MTQKRNNKKGLVLVRKSLPKQRVLTPEETRLLNTALDRVKRNKISLR